MTEKIELQLKQLNSKAYQTKRKHIEAAMFDDIEKSENFINNFQKIVALEEPCFLENDEFGFNRSTDLTIPPYGGNVTPNYYRIISQGFDAVLYQIGKAVAKTTDSEKIAYGKNMAKCIHLCLEFCSQYKTAAKASGNLKLYGALKKVPHKGAESFYEACVFLKICIYFLRISFVDHLGLGRFDQYMYPFYLHDKACGVQDNEIFETLESFFIAINRDADLYSGVQQGDNGQSLVLGGFDKAGNSQFNELSQMCMQASLELNLIDPKINLRVGKNTPDEIFEFATLLTKQGLGFPQYCNDDVVIPGLLKLGYEYEDALNYVVAACWEFIIPNCGADVPNIQTMDFPAVVNRAIVANLTKCKHFDKLMDCVKKEIEIECGMLIHSRREQKVVKRPLLSIFIDGCIECLADMYDGGAKYHNFGCHGAGIANAADALAAVKKNIFDEKTIEKSELLNALANNFRGHDELRNQLRNSLKMGNNDDYVDSIACDLMDCFSNHLNNKKNGHGGVWRAGTGSAMEYIWKGEKCPATADGRKAKEAYSSSFSPALDAKTAGVLSVMQSFTKYPLCNMVNGGPLTIEIHDTVLRNDVGIKKVAMLVKSYILLGGHQLQLNSINRERLLDAQKHPENYPNLIVRVWGWSGYFNELDLSYQNHIIRRTEYGS